ncbi:hypothetical protein [Microbacterium aquimaris]|uniref:DUF222 domain-containing protein n=1 Tax=Microbacterium aquimaris TaxID=459816 RepID=A0ABU5N8G1_9MICO|nr:hypothetical protein [Microbacterium aquimaris]MDZ8162343.1 hypothetical protein [Microbacterium aquimaris]
MSTNTTTLTSLRTILRKLDITLPKPIRDAYADTDRLNTAARDIEPVTSKQIAHAWGTAILEDRDPHTDPAVQRLITINALGDSIAQKMADTAEDHIIDALRANTRPILEALRNLATTAGKTLEDANTVLRGLPLEDRETIAAHGSKHLAAWEQATAANSTLKNVDRAWSWLQTLTRFAPASEWIVRLADVDLDTFEKHRRRCNPWDLIVAGHSIDLAIDTDTIQARNSRRAEEHADRIAAGDAARRKLMNPSAGISLIPAV